MDKIKDSVKKFFKDIADGFKAHKPTKRSFLKLLALILSTAVLFGIGVLTVSFSMRAFVNDNIVDAPDGKYDCILILGCLVRGETPSDMLKDRLDTGIDLYLKGAAPAILMSGDGENPAEYDEVTVMKNYALSRGVPEEDIICDPYGLCTYDSIWRAENVYDMDSFIIVSQKYHLTRAIYIAEKMGLEACGVPAYLNLYTKQLYRNVREVLARFKDFFLVMTGKDAEYTE